MRRFMRRDRKADARGRLGMETLENRALMAVVSSMPHAGEVGATQVPIIELTAQLCQCSDTGVPNDNITSATAPRFTGMGTPRSTVTLSLEGGASPGTASVSVAEGGRTLGTARVNPRGIWSFISRGVPIPEGVQVIRVTEAGTGRTASTTVTFDRQKPTASIAFTGLDSFRVTFDRAVTGFTERLRGLYFSGQPEGAPRFNLPFTSAQLKRYVGPIEFTASSDGRTYDIRMPDLTVKPGKYQLRLVAAKSGVVDAVNGNRLAANASSPEQTVAG